MNRNQRPADRDEIEPLIDVDDARERPRSVEQMTDVPDTGALTDNPHETVPDNEDDADIVPGDKTAIYERGTTILPPG